MATTDGKTMIEVTKKTRAKLQQIRICKRESYEEVILRLMGGDNGKDIQG